MNEFERRMQGKSRAYKAAMIEVARALAEFAQADATEKHSASTVVDTALEQLQKVIDRENN